MSAALLETVLLLKFLDHRGLRLFSRLPAAGLDEVGDRIGHAALGRRLRRLVGPVDRPRLIRRHDHPLGDLLLGDVPDHVVDRQRQRSRIGLQHAPENVVMRGLLVEEVIAHCEAWFDRAHDLAEGLR